MCRAGALRPSMRTLGGKVVGGRWGRSPVWWRLVGGVQGRLRCVLLCLRYVSYPLSLLMCQSFQSHNTITNRLLYDTCGCPYAAYWTTGCGGPSSQLKPGAGMGISGPERTGAKAAETKALAWLPARVVWHREHHSSAAPRTRVDRYRSPACAVGRRARSPPGQLPTSRVSAFTAPDPGW